MTTLYLIRHAQADGNLYRRCQAWYDGLITPVGYRQIEALKDRFSDTHFDVVYSSDLFRTMTTAKAIYESHGLPLHTDPELREIGSGCWEDRPWGELLRNERDSLLAFWRCDPTWQVEGGETFEGIIKRFDGAVRRIAARHPGQTIAVFAHGCIIRSTLAYWLGLPADRIRDIPHGDNTSVAQLEYKNDSIHVCWYNDISHLSGELARAPHPAAETDEATAAGIERSSMYFLPFDLACESKAYLEARADVWKSEHNTLNGFDDEAVLQSAKICYDVSPDSFMTAMLNGQPIGILQLDHIEVGDSTGYVTFMYLRPEFRGRGLGVQMIGQAVSSFRALGLQYVNLDCPRENCSIRKFFMKHGFSETEESSKLKKYIGY